MSLRTIVTNVLRPASWLRIRHFAFYFFRRGPIASGLLPLLAVCSLFAVAANIAHGQTDSASLSGTIVDRQGGLVIGAQVTAVDTATGVRYVAKTNTAGVYDIPYIKPGHYRLLIEKEGFKQVDVRDVILNVQDSANQNFTLEVGGTSETVVVNAEALNINTTDGSISTVVDRQFAENLPLNGRTFQSLINLAPGVLLNAGSGTGLYAFGQFSVDGQRATSNYWTVDGVGANIGVSSNNVPGNGAAGGLGAFSVLGGTNSLVSVDALQEFRIQTSTYAPEFGRVPGGQISIVTRSGTNQFHGSAFDYLRNTVLDAEDWFASANGLPKAAERQNDFGGVLGGPIIKNRTFFFFSYEGLRLDLPGTAFTTVPDLAARTAAIPAMQPYLNAYPFPDGPEVSSVPGAAEFNATFSNPAKLDATSLRIDHALSNTLNLFGRYDYSPSHLAQRAAVGTGSSVNDVTRYVSLTQTGTVGATWTKSSQLVNETRFNFSSVAGSQTNQLDGFGGGASTPAATLFPSGVTYQNGFFDFLPLVGNDMALWEGKLAHNVQRQYNIVDTVSVQKRTHTLKFGVDYRRLSPLIDWPTYGLYPLFGDVMSAETGQPFITLQISWPHPTFLFRNIGLFSQDTWRVTSRLTVTYGLRWDVDFTPTTESGPSIPAVTGFSTTNLSSLALAPAGTALYSTKYGNVAPRLGIAYQVSQDPGWGLVLRGGFGVFYDLASSEVLNAGIYVYPFQNEMLSAGIPFPTPKQYAVEPPAVPPSATQGTLFGFDPNLSSPYTLQWSFSAEQSLGNAQTVKASYIGSDGRRLLTSEYVTNPNANYAEAGLVANASTSSYNALQIQFQRHLAAGLQTLASYTWSHSIDTASYGAYADGSLANVNANRGNSDFDIRNSFSLALTYNIPTLRKSAFTRAIFSGWSTENILQIRSASPVDIVDGHFTALTLTDTSIDVRPDVVPGQPLYLHGSQYPGGKALNPNAFIDPPTDPTTGLPTRQGDLGRNAARGFGLTQWDFAVHRSFPIHEGLNLQFRAEMFNVLNHPNFAPFNRTFGTDPYFGQSTAMFNQGAVGGSGELSAQYQLGGPRSIQLALKLSF
jgi:hypothetical protein